MIRAQQVFEHIALVNGVDKEVANEEIMQELLCGTSETSFEDD